MQETMNDRVPPQDLDAEQATLGAMLLDARAAEKAFGIVKEEDFYREAHKHIFNAMQNIHACEEPLDIITVSATLRQANNLEAVGGGEYLTALMNKVPTSAHVERYAKIVFEKSLLRQLIIAGDKIQAAGYSNLGAVTDAISDAQQAMAEVLDASRIGSGLEGMAAVAPGIIDWIETQREQQRGVYGLRSGISEIDNALQGFSNQRLVLVKGQTKHGKTAFCGQIIFASAVNMHKDDGIILVFCLEGTQASFMRRFVTWYSRVESRHLRQGGYYGVSDNQNTMIFDAYQKMLQLPIQITDKVFDISEIENEIRGAALQGKVAGVLIDYAQLITGGKGDTNERKLANIAERLQRLANELETTILLPSQVTMQNDGRVTEKGATALRDNCSLCLHVVRGEGKMEQHERLQSPIMNILCEAARDDAPFGSVKCKFNGSCYRIEGEFKDHNDKSLNDSRNVSGG